MNLYWWFGIAVAVVLIVGAVLFYLAGPKRRKKGIHIEELTFITPEVAGTFTWKLSPRATEMLKKYGDGEDPTFAEHHVNKFIFFVMASMIASTPERKKAAREIIQAMIEECENRMSKELCTKKPKEPYNNPDVK